MIDKYQIHHEIDVLLLLRHIWKIVFTSLILLLLPHFAWAEIKDDKANRIVSGIISFTQWPGLKNPELCALSSARHLSLPQHSASPAATFTVVYLANVNDIALHRCDAVYFGDQTPQQQVEAIQQFHGRAVLTLAENNAECTVGAAFCLIFQPDHTHFSVNLDSLTRSGVRVSPDVLLLSREGSE
ncbi:MULTISPECIES: YfiR family protein [unclassified Pantoea]|uniref:YfiR family protein n=1 Tax=unclassified Pantoea TaxID=2630326 RepID=UPI0015D078A0|nr:MULTISPECIES: YfiR family protein [unclassified Pantoea]NYS30678.1 YfiR family protein [Pantoea sp. WMus005]